MDDEKWMQRLVDTLVLSCFAALLSLAVTVLKLSKSLRSPRAERA